MGVLSRLFSGARLLLSRLASSISSSLLAAAPLALKQLRSAPGLSAAVAGGLTAAVALATAVPLYADAINHRLLGERLATERRPPFAFLFRYVGSWHGLLEWEEIQAADAYLSQQVVADLGLPLVSRDPVGVVRHVRTQQWALLPVGETGYATPDDPLEWISLGFLQGLAGHVEVIEGQGLGSASPPAGDGEEVPVVVSQELAYRMGLQVGEVYLLDPPGASGGPVRVRIAGVWRALDEDATYWPYDPGALENVMLTTEAWFAERVAPAVAGEVGQAVWYLVADGSSVTSSGVPALIDRIAATRSKLGGLLPNAALDVSPEEELRRYRAESTSLTLQLFAFGTPVVGLIVYSVALVAGMAARRQQGQTVVLRSRGGTKGQVVALYLLQWSLLGLAALAAGWPLGWAAAGLMSRSSSFLAFAGLPAGEGGALRVLFDWGGLRFGFLAALLSVLAATLPALSVSRHTVVTHQQALAQALQRPWWQRYYLDVILVVPAVYGYVLLRRPSGLPLSELTQGDLFGNPILFLVPSLFVFSVGLLTLRLVPLLTKTLARLSRQARGGTLLLVFDSLSRQTARLAGPLLLLILTSALAVFSASLALTSDIHLHDRTYYRVGADLRLVEAGETEEEGDSAEYGLGGGAEETGDWVFLPISEHLEVPGVEAAARVGSYSAAANLGGERETGRFVGVDRLDFESVAFFRGDFAPQSSLRALMNALAADRRALLVERSFLDRNGLQVGDPLRLSLDVLGERAEIDFVVAGSVDLFPTQYPEDGPFFVGNLRYVFLRLGGLYPYDVWLAVEPGGTDSIVMALKQKGVPVLSVRDSRQIIGEEQQSPRRQGLFGLLTLGFLAAGLLTVVGLALNALVSYRERTIEFGVLRTLGLSIRQMRLYLAGEQVALLVMGMIVGTLLGVGSAGLFIPFLQAEATLHPHTPPFLVRIAWGDVALIYVLLAATAAISIRLTLSLLRRMRIHQAIKMGEAL
jgi:putative ABC transport system permease protein